VVVGVALAFNHAAREPMHRTIVTALIMGLTISPAYTQTSGSGGTGGSTGGAASPGTGSPATRAPAGSPGLTPTPSGPLTPNRSNSEVFPPSRVLPDTQGQAPNTRGSSAITPETGTPSGGSRVPNPATGGVGSSQESKTGKNAKETVADCLKQWDAATHMSKSDWATTCRRIQGRLDNIQ
jgi:hypothetical protein